MKKILLFIIFICTWSNPSSAGRLGGPGMMAFSLKPKEETVYAIYLLEDKPIYFVGFGKGGEVDYYLYDPNRKLISYDIELGSDCNISYNTKIPGKYFILAVNNGKDHSEVTIRTN